MKTQHVFSASAAAVLAVSMAAFAQSPQTAAPSTQAPTPSTEQASPSNQPGSSPSQAAQQPSAQANRQADTPVTLVGCVMRETDYRKANASGRGGPLATGLGRGDEFVLVNATKTAAGASTPSTSGECGSTATGEAYELGGSREKDLASYVGRRVEITGTLKEAKTTAAGTAPTGGFDPLKQDLKLFEVDVASFRPVASSQSTAAPAAAPEPAVAPAPQPPPAAAAQPQASAPRPSPATPPQQSASAAPRQNLPRTASPLPVAALFGLLSVTTGLVLRRRE